MSDNTTNQTQLNQELQNLIDDTRMVLKTIEVKREEISEGVTAEIEQLKSATKALTQENVSLQSMPKKVTAKIQELLPSIVEQLARISEKTNQDFAKNANITMQQNNIAVKEIASEFKTLKQDFDRFDRQRTKRYFRGFGVVLLISVLASLGATYAMMKAFPKYVRIESSGNVTVQESEVSLWNAKNISVSGDVKKR